MVGVDVTFFQFGADNLLPVGDQRVKDVGLRIGELGAEALADGDAVFLGDDERAVVLLEQAEDAAPAEEQVGGTSDVGVAAFGCKAHGRQVDDHRAGRRHLFGHRVGAVVHVCVLVGPVAVEGLGLLRHELELRLSQHGKSQHRARLNLPSGCLAEVGTAANLLVAVVVDGGVVVGGYLLIGERCHRSGARRAAYNHIH